MARDVKSEEEGKSLWNINTAMIGPMRLEPPLDKIGLFGDKSGMPAGQGGKPGGQDFCDGYGVKKE